MLKDQTTQPTLFQEDSHANHSQLQENEEEKTMIVTSGMKLLELLPKQNQNGLLAKMLRGLLTSTTAWYSDRCKLIWKKKVSKSNVLLYQLQASVHGIKGKGFGSLPTPRARDHFPAVDPKQVTMNSKGWTSTRKGTGVKYGATLPDVVNKLYPTPTVGCEEGGEQSKRVEQMKRAGSLAKDVMTSQNLKPGGKLNPNFVEFLMGYPMNWTKIDPTE